MTTLRSHALPALRAIDVKQIGSVGLAGLRFLAGVTFTAAVIIALVNAYGTPEIWRAVLQGMTGV